MKRYILAAVVALCAGSTSAAYAACTVPNAFTNGTTADATQVNANFTAVLSCVNTPAAIPTRQIFTSGTSLTYTSPAGARQLRIRMVGGGGGGGSYNVGSGSGGGGTTFNAITASGGGAGVGGGVGSAGTGGPGGTGGSGAASFRSAGQKGSDAYLMTPGAPSSPGGSSLLGRGSVDASTAGNGGGGYGATYSGSGGGGGAGEYVELIINSPSATYTYTVGAGGAAGSGSINGGAGGAGIIIVDELY